MDDADIERLILGYSNHLEELQYLADVAGAVEPAALESAIIGLLLSEDATRIWHTCALIQGLVLLRPPHDACRSFRESYPRSSVVGALEGLVTAPDHRIRSHAVYTLGKTGSTHSLPVLRHAFHSLLEKDPLLLPSLASEILWLEKEHSLDLIDEALASGQYLTRWASFGIIQGLSDDRQLKTRVCARLLGDSNSRVRAEAEYEQALLDHQANSDSMTKTARRAARREIERRRPPLCFANLDIAFGNYLYHHSRRDYTVSELDQFVRQQPD
jgi:hypothetical protein